MADFNKKDIVDLAVNTYYGTNTKFSKEDLNDTLRNQFVNILGTDKIDYRTLRRDGALVFEILEEAIGNIAERRIEEEFGKFAEYKNTGWGDTTVFTLQDPKLFDVAVIADGNADLFRQRIDNGEFTVPVYTRGVKIYENFYRLVSGRTDWTTMVNKVIDSYMNEIYKLVYKAMYDQYASLGTSYKTTGSFDSSALDEIIEHVEAANNASAMIVGTRSALSKVVGTYISENMKDQFGNQGYLADYNGTPLMRIKQVHEGGTDNFAIDNNFLMVLPTGGEKIVKILEEGNSVIKEVNQTGMDLGSEYLFIRKSGVAVVTNSKIGMYKLA